MDISKHNLELKTGRLYLRPLNESDSKALWPYCSNPDFPIYMSWHAHTELKQTKAFIKQSEENMKNGTGLNWSIFQNNVFCGLIGLEDIQWKIGDCETGGVAELGYWLIPQAWGKGIMSEASEAVLKFGFEQIELNKITVAHVSENHQSQKVIEKLGFRYLGEARQHWKKNGTWYDHKLYEMLKTEFA